MKKFFCLLMLLLLSGLAPVFGQPDKDTIFHNTVKLNVAAGYFRNLSLFYERKLNDHWSLQMGAGSKFGGKIPKIIGLGNVVLTSNTGGIKGFSFTPEARYHFRFCDCNDWTGLYAGVYARYTRLFGDMVFNFWNGNEYIDVGGAGDMREYGFGLQLGYQFVFKKRFIVDLMFMGPRTSFQKLKLELDSDFAADVIPLIEEELNKRLEWMGMDPVSIPTDPSASVKFRFSNFRYGVGIGYLF